VRRAEDADDLTRERTRRVRRACVEAVRVDHVDLGHLRRLVKGDVEGVVDVTRDQRQRPVPWLELELAGQRRMYVRNNAGRQYGRLDRVQDSHGRVSSQSVL